MGDRRNVIVKDGESDIGVGLYTHWSGSDLEDIVKSALQRKQRWEDAPYLARIIFCEMVKGNEREETGFGIAAGNNLCEGSARDITIDVAAQTIRTRQDAKPVSLSAFIAA